MEEQFDPGPIEAMTSILYLFLRQSVKEQPVKLIVFSWKPLKSVPFLVLDPVEECTLQIQWQVRLRLWE